MFIIIVIKITIRIYMQGMKNKKMLTNSYKCVWCEKKHKQHVLNKYLFDSIQIPMRFQK